VSAQARLVQVTHGLLGEESRIRGAPSRFGVEGWHFARGVVRRADLDELTDEDIAVRKRMRELDFERAAGFHMHAMMLDEIGRTKRERTNLAEASSAMRSRSSSMADALAGFRRTTDGLSTESLLLEVRLRKLQAERRAIVEAAAALRSSARAEAERGFGVVGRQQLFPMLQTLLGAADMAPGV